MRATLAVAGLTCVIAAAAGLAPPPAAAQSGTFQTLYRFTGGADGATPYRGPLIDSTGTLYGTTFAGANDCADAYAPGTGCGALWALKSGVVTPELTFLGASNGAAPNTNLTASGATLYSATSLGGADDQGTLFRVGKTGTNYKLLHSFTGNDGAQPNGAL